jgi:SPP1 gp7 family putative phage head morphogenesis protein
MQPSPYRLSPKTCPACLRPQNNLLAQDRAQPSARSAFIRAKKLETDYARRLRKVASHVQDIVKGFDVSTLPGSLFARTALEQYARILTPWAQAVGQRMVTEVAARDERSWFQISERMGKALRQEIATAPTGEVMRERMAEQVKLITSLPTEAADRVHRLALQGITEGWRADRIADEIMATGHVTRARANLIARTEVGRTSTLLTQARAEHVGSEGYNWRTAKDSDVRPSHKAMAGKFVKWTEPPTLDGMTGHAGALPNCRCFCEPVIPD